MGMSPAWPNCAGDHTVHIPAIAVGHHSQKAKRDSNWCEEERYVGQAFEWNPAFRGRFPFIIHWPTPEGLGLSPSVGTCRSCCD